MPIKDLEERRKYAREWVAKRRADFFMNKSCVECGSTEKLELDHVDPAQKVSHSIWSWSAERRAAEIAKCQVLCHKCHKAKSIAQMPVTHGFVPYRHGTRAMYDKGCKCGLCMLVYRNRWRSIRARDRAA